MQDNINDLIEKHTGLIFKQIQKFHLAYDPEAESLGYEALYNAIRTYDESKNIKFSTYATICIYNALGTYVRKKKKQKQLEEVSYNAIAYNEEGGDHEFEDFLEAPVDVEQVVADKVMLARVLKELDKLEKSLTMEKQKRVMKAWRETCFEASTAKVAELAEVSQPYAWYVIGKFRKALKERLKNEYE